MRRHVQPAVSTTRSEKARLSYPRGANGVENEVRSVTRTRLSSLGSTSEPDRITSVRSTHPRATQQRLLLLRQSSNVTGFPSVVMVTGSETGRLAEGSSSGW